MPRPRRGGARDHADHPALHGDRAFQQRPVLLRQRLQPPRQALGSLASIVAAPGVARREEAGRRRAACRPAWRPRAAGRARPAPHSLRPACPPDGRRRRSGPWLIAVCLLCAQHCGEDRGGEAEPPCAAICLPIASTSIGFHAASASPPPNAECAVSTVSNIGCSNWPSAIASKSCAACHELAHLRRRQACWPAAAAAAAGCGRSSAHLQIGLQRAGRLDRLQDADQVARPDAERVQARHQVAQASRCPAGCRACGRAGRPPGSACAARRRCWPLENGPGWLTSGVSVTRMVRLPWAIATVLIRTLAPMTMVPLASSITTMAGLSGSTRRSSMRGQRSIGSRPARSSATVRGSVAPWRPAAERRLIAAAMRRAVVRSGLRRPSRSALRLVEPERDLALDRRAVGDARRRWARRG